MLDTCRVLDLTDERGQLAGMILAQLGAEVIAVEPPEGVRSRRLRPTPARHLAYNRGKKSVVIDRTTDEGRDRFAALVATADVLIESADNGDVAALGLDWPSLQQINPRLVVVSISAFGRSGPKANWAASDLIVEASACELFLSGDADRPPVRVSYPQAFLNAAADAACGALVALWERRQSGLGQWVDISAQEATAMMTQGQILAAGYGAQPILRNGGGLRVGALDIRWLYPAADGWVTITLLFGPIAAFTVRLAEWMVEAGFLDAEFAATNWFDFLGLVMSGKLPASDLDRLQEAITAFTSAHTKAELLDGALKRRVLLAPVSTAPELLDSEQLEARHYWADIDGLRQPGPFLAASGGPALSPLGASPELGAHTEAILGALPPTVPTSLVPSNVPIGMETGMETGIETGVEPARPLAGVKVVDLTWFMAGPATTRMLADWGATVVRVESAKRPDAGRGSGPFLNGRSDPDSGGYGLTHNAGKLALALDLSKPESRPVLEDLIRWADVAVVNYSPRAARKMGLDWDTLSAVNPQLVLVSSCLMGQTGPLAEFSGFGNLSAAIAGFYEIGGWPDRAPVGPYLAYTDVVAPRFTFSAILAALEERRRTNTGRYLDVSQAESSMWLLAPAVLDYQLSGQIPVRIGNDDVDFAPHGVYPTTLDEGEREGWVAIAVTTDEQWRALAVVMGRDDLAEQAAFAGAEGRLGRRRELDAVVSAWTSGRTAAAVEEALQAVGVPAHRVADSAGCWADPQLDHRGHFQRLSHPHHGEVQVQGPRLRFSRSVCATTRAAPPIGEDSFEVLTDLLGYGADRVADLAVAEVLS
ncbi:MAG: CaiB/BaiF CoA transferase family protein [Acidimicrobiales bacterium]